MRRIALLALLLVGCAAPATPATPATPIAPTPPPATPTSPPALTATTLPAPTKAPPPPPTPLPEPTTLLVESSAFSEGGTIPVEYTCNGTNISPPLRWSEVPAGTKSIVVIMEDRNANNFSHWTVFNLPPTTRELPAALPNEWAVPNGGWQAQNAFAKPGYGGPCPPANAAHTYAFQVYAVAIEVALEPSDLSPVSKGMVREEIADSILAVGSLSGIYTAP
ncbi:MAG: hypothetical protein OHK0050_36620 [Roseiflexaceae bacterium]